jgi:O-antigen/teichoic acid export membrane protein
MAKPKFGLVAGYVVSLVGGVLSLAMYAHVLGPANYGRMAVYLAVVEGLQTVLFQWHRLAAVRFWAKNEREDFESFLNTYNMFGFGMGMVVLAGVGLYAVWSWSGSTYIWSLVIALGLAKSAALYAQELARAAGASVRYGIGALLLTAGGASVGIAAYWKFHTIESILVVTTITFLSSALICAGPVSWRVRTGHLRIRYVSEMLRYGLPLILVFLASTALTKLDRPILAKFEDVSIVGVYAAAMALISNVVSATFLLIVTPTYPWLLREKVQLADSEFRRMHATVGLLLITVSLGICTTFFCARGFILPLLLGEEIGVKATDLVLPLLIVSLIGAFRTHFFDQAFHIFGKTSSLMLINVAVLIIATAALYVGASLGGLKGLLWGMGLANVASMALSVFVSKSFVAVRHLIARGAGLFAIATLVVLGSEELNRLCGSTFESRKSIIGLANAMIAFCIFALVGYFMHANSLKKMLQKQP